MPVSWEVRFTQITINDDQSQVFEPIFGQSIDFEPDLLYIRDMYGPSIHVPPPAPLPAGMMMSPPMPGTMMPAIPGTMMMPNLRPQLATSGPHKGR